MEAFCGYCYVGERVRCSKRYFSDLNLDLILMWQALQNGWKPPTELSEEEYKALRDAPPSPLRGFAQTQCTFGCTGTLDSYRRELNKEKRDALLAQERCKGAMRAFAASCCSFGSRGVLSGYARNSVGANYAAIGARQLTRRLAGLRSGVFAYSDYRKAMDSVDADVIYLDPPYAGTSEYKAVEPFDSDKFWDEVRKRSDGRRRILVSEYQAPDDFTVVMTAYSRMGLTFRGAQGLKREKRLERVFEYQPPKGRSQVSFASLLEA